MENKLIDSHCHLTCDELYERVDEIIESARMNDVEEILVMCTNFEEFERAKDIQKKYDGISIALGFHPIDLYNFNESDYGRLELVIKQKEIVVLGEIGLDYHWDTVSKEDQINGFIRQIELANKYNFPISIHMRDATLDTLNILKEHCKTKFLMHCFSGSKETAIEIMKMGGYISFAGVITFKNAKGLLEVPQVIDLDKLLVETDAPYLTPHPFRGKRNEPMYLKYTFEKVAQLLGMSEDELAKQIASNYHTFINL